MKTPSQKFIAVSSAFAGILLSLSAVQAQTIFQDSFNGTGELIGQTPTTGTPGATWTSGSVSAAGVFTEGTGVLSFTTTSPGNFPPYDFLPYAGTNFVDGATYTLSLDMNLANTDANFNWAGLGFFTSNANANQNYVGTVFGNGLGWMLNKGTGSDLQYFTASVTGPSGTASGAGASTATLSIKLAIGNTGAGSLSYYSGTTLLNATPLTLTAAQVASISGVGLFKNNTISGSFDNFSFTGNVVPEPSTWVMMLSGVVGLVLLRRFRFARA